MWQILTKYQILFQSAEVMQLANIPFLPVYEESEIIGVVGAKHQHQ